MEKIHEKIYLETNEYGEYFITFGDPGDPAHEYYKTKDGYKIAELTDGKAELDVRYYWDIVSRLLDKFGLKHLVRKNPPLTILDKKQKSLMEFV